MVGRVRRQRARGDARPRPGGRPDDAAPVAIVPLMHRHEVEPGDVELRTTIRHAAGPRLTPVPPDAKAVFFGAWYHADYATILRAPRRPAGRRRRAGRLLRPRRRSRPPAAVGRRGPAAPAERRPGARRAGSRRSGAARSTAGWTVSMEHEEVCPVASLPEGARHRRLPRHAGQEGAPRDPAQGPPRRGRRRGPSRRLGRPAGRPARLHRPPPEALGRATACSRHGPGGDAEPGLLPPPVRAVRRRRPAAPRVPDGRRPPDRGGRLVRDGRRDPTTTTPAWTRRRASCRRAWSWSSAIVRRALEHGRAAPGLPARRRALQVRVGRRGRAHPAAAGQTN